MKLEEFLQNTVIYEDMPVPFSERHVKLSILSLAFTFILSLTYIFTLPLLDYFFIGQSMVSNIWDLRLSVIYVNLFAVLSIFVVYSRTKFDVGSVNDHRLLVIPVMTMFLNIFYLIFVCSFFMVNLFIWSLPFIVVILVVRAIFEVLF